jgi:CRISPR/Cas system CMR subunit Cmr6 (Cas7 group RAMP superfamily)
MSEEKIITEKEIHTNPTLAMPVQPDTELKNILVEYVGTKLDKEEITVQMISEVLATDFPEFTFAFAEENFLRGYQLGINDAQGLYYPKATTD